MPRPSSPHACVRFGLSIVPYAPLHGGLLADLAVLDREIAGDKRYGGAGFTPAEIAIARELDRLAREWNLGMQQVSLAWLLSRPAVASVIVGAESTEELQANASAADVELTVGQLEAVSALTEAHSDRPLSRARSASGRPPRCLCGGAGADADRMSWSFGSELGSSRGCGQAPVRLIRAV